MNGSSLGVPDLSNNKVGMELKAMLFALPHHVKRVISAEGKENRLIMNYHLDKPVKIRVYRFLVDALHGKYEYGWTEHSIVKLSDKCFFNSEGQSKPYWSIVDYKIL